MATAPRILPPQMFDLSTDIAEYVPPEIIHQWEQSEKTEADALEILRPNLVEGTLVSSDTSGLSKLSQELSLVEVLALINKPKEIIYKMGRTIGGEGIGIWAADNTQMFYDQSISQDLILNMLVSTQSQIEKYCDVKVGLGAHYGKFFRIGNGMYGVEADYIEKVAEEEVGGGETCISEPFFNRLQDTTSRNFVPRADLAERLHPVFSVRCSEGEDCGGDLEFDNEFVYPISLSIFKKVKASRLYTINHPV